MALNSQATVAICAYTMERIDDLHAAVESVRQQDPAPGEILVVIDHNPDLLRVASTLQGVTAIPSTGPKGLSGARNTAIAAATTDVLVFFDDDAIAEPGWLEALVAPLDPERPMVTGGAARAEFDQDRPGWFPSEFDWVVGCTYTGHVDQIAEIRNPIGCNMAFTRAALEAAGDFRTEMGRQDAIPLGCEETELCIRLRQRAPEVSITYRPTAVVSQRVPPARASLPYFLRRCYAEGLSKAAVSRLVGSTDALSSERTYTTKVLPAAVIHGIRESFTQRSTTGVLRACAVIGGLGATAIGYLQGSRAMTLD
jgi:glycosyltransferase involved in cell wall biosynthesis